MAHCCGCTIARRTNRRVAALVIVVALVAGVVALVGLSKGNKLAAVGWGIIVVQWAGSLAGRSWRHVCDLHGEPTETDDPPLPPAAA